MTKTQNKFGPLRSDLEHLIDSDKEITNILNRYYVSFYKGRLRKTNKLLVIFI